MKTALSILFKYTESSVTRLGNFLKVLATKFSSKSSPNILKLPIWATLKNITFWRKRLWPLFIPTSGHTDSKIQHPTPVFQVKNNQLFASVALFKGPDLARWKISILLVLFLVHSATVWPDLAIYWILGKFLKP